MQIENKWVNLKWVSAWNGHGQLKVGEQINLKWGLSSTCMGLGFISRWVNKTWGLLSTHMGLGSNSSPHPQLTATLNEPHVALNALTSLFFHAQSITVDWMEGGFRITYSRNGGFGWLDGVKREDVGLRALVGVSICMKVQDMGMVVV